MGWVGRQGGRNESEEGAGGTGDSRNGEREGGRGGSKQKRELNLEEEGKERKVKSSKPLLPVTLLGTQ